MCVYVYIYIYSIYIYIHIYILGMDHQPAFSVAISISRYKLLEGIGENSLSGGGTREGPAIFSKAVQGNNPTTRKVTLQDMNS